jgi:steroid delta-isomerase-like uncharacterized protein
MKGSREMSEANAMIVHNYLQEAWNGRNVDLIDTFLAEDCAVHNLPAQLPSGRAGARENLRRTLDTFPDFAVTVDDTVSQSDRVAVRLTFTGTHQGGFYGMPATGKAFSIPAIAIARLEDGKIAEWWQIGDTLGLLQQIGAMPG